MSDRETPILNSQKKSELGIDVKVINVEVAGEPPEWIRSLSPLIAVSFFFRTYTVGEIMKKKGALYEEGKNM